MSQDGLCLIVLRNFDLERVPIRTSVAVNWLRKPGTHHSFLETLRHKLTDYETINVPRWSVSHNFEEF